MKMCEVVPKAGIAGVRNGVSSVIVAIFILDVLISFLISFYLIMNEFGRTMSNVVAMLSKEAEKGREKLSITGSFLTPSGLVLDVVNDGSYDTLIKLAYVRDCATGKYLTTAVNALLHPRNSTYVVISGAFRAGGRYVVALITSKGNVFKSEVTLSDYVTLVRVRNDVPEELKDYQVAVRLDSTWVGWGYVDPQGRDIYFTDNSGKPLHYWIERFDPVAKEALIWVKVPVLPPLSEVMLFLHYGGSNPYAPYYEGPYGTFYIFVNLSQFADTNAWIMNHLDGNAAYDPTTHVLQLTNTSKSQLGYLYFTKAPSDPIGFVANFTFKAYGGTGADAIWLGAYDTTHEGTTEDIVKGGYHFTFDEYQDRIAFTNSTVDNGDPLAYKKVKNIDNGVWHNVSIIFWYNPASRSATAVVYYDGRLKINYTVKVAYNQINVMLGKGELVFGGRTGALTNYHELGGVICVRKYVRPEPTVTLIEIP